MFQRIAFFSLFLIFQTTLAFPNCLASSNPKVIDVDVAIVGGGAAGTYAAVRLREDLNASVVLIERESHLGGHVNTYNVPETNTTVEYGVQSYIRNSAALDFFARFGVDTQLFTARRLSTINIDVASGARLTDYIPPSINATNEAFQRWLLIVAKYETMFELGFWNFPRPQDIPSELLVPIEEFVKTHQLDAAIPRILAISGLGYGGIRHLLTFNLVQSFGPSLTRQVIDGQLFIPVGSNSLVYERARTLLGKDVLLSANIQSVKRTLNGTSLLVDRNGLVQINAKRILWTAAPSLPVMLSVDLDSKEKAVFSKWSIGGEYVGVAKIPCLAENTSISFLPKTAVPSNHVALKDYGFSERLDSTGPTGLSLFRVVFGSNFTVPQDQFVKQVAFDVQKLRDAGTIPGEGKCSVEFKAISSHTRPSWKQTAEQLEAGFVQDLYSLQGYRSTWYTGATWAAPYSSTVWAYTDTVLPKLLADIKNKK
ncbi:hypothetical protein GQ44DRAFT_600763 [Phaeosphaeriaceae sp. PMI808]|nr:hypothetical protein GQ44DRAFT_600763 [Phaeosphaeriaceae sp. PMI808]